MSSRATFARIDDGTGGLLAVQFRFGLGVGEICHQGAVEAAEISDIDFPQKKVTLINMEQAEKGRSG